MIDLAKKSGLPLQWDPSRKILVFGQEMSSPDARPDIRRRSEMTEVLYDTGAGGPEELYYMYRGVSLAGDEKIIESKGLRYDVTVICPGVLGREYIKTAGHYHPVKPGQDLTYPEVYEVLHGRAHYLLQKPYSGRFEELESVLLITAKPGDKVLIPPQYGHITVNPGDDYLIMSNWVARDFSSIYEPLRKMHGGAYYELHSEDGPEFIANKSYRQLPPLQRCAVTPVSQLNLITGLPLYQVFKENSGAFEFLTGPENYRQIFDDYLKELTSS